MTTVLQIIPSLNAGGAEQATVDIAGALSLAGHKALVISSGGRLVREVERLGAQHLVHSMQSKNPLQIMGNAFYLARLIRRERIDILHARSRAPAWSAWLASVMTGCHFMTTFHAAYKFSNPLKRFYNSVMTRGIRVIAISEFIADHIKSTYHVDPSKIRAIPRSIDFDKFAPHLVTLERQEALKNEWGLTKGESIILLPARLSPIKGHITFIKALALLPRDIQVTAVIVGDDQGRSAYRHELECLIRDQKLENRVRLVKHCEDMPAAYSLATLMVAPSLIPEGFGRTPIEAMAMGVPVIASDLGGHRETVEPKDKRFRNGWLFPAGDEKALAQSLLLALALKPEDRLSMTKTAAEFVRTHYDKKVMVRDTLAVYDELKRSL